MPRDNHSGAGVSSPHRDKFSSDASWDVTEIEDGEFQHYFREQDGRLFHSHGDLPYPLPADTPEQERLNALHLVVKRLLSQNFVGPVSEVLAPATDRRKYALDICNGTGRWVMEMANQFPHVQFYGLDIVPIATRRPLENVQFEIHDVNTPVRWLDKTIDFVHARNVSMALSNYQILVKEIARVLRSGGLFLSGEWDPLPTFDGHAPGNVDLIPATYRLINMVNQTLHQKHGVIPVGPLIPGWLQQSGRFMSITHQVHFVPIGDWHPNPEMRVLGNDFKVTMVQYGDSLKPMLKDAGYEDTLIEEVLQGFSRELNTVPGMVWVYRTVYAWKV